MALSDLLLRELEEMPRQLESAVRLIPRDRLRWTPESWEGSAGDRFSAIEHVCHLRDIERDGYHVRIDRMLAESDPSLVSVDGYALARERRYAEDDLEGALAAFRGARAATVERLRALDDGQLERAGTFAEYGRLTLRGLVHYLRSHDQQHLAGLQFVAGKLASERGQ